MVGRAKKTTGKKLVDGAMDSLLLRGETPHRGDLASGSQGIQLPSASTRKGLGLPFVVPLVPRAASKPGSPMPPLSRPFDRLASFIERKRAKADAHDVASFSGLSSINPPTHPELASTSAFKKSPLAERGSGTPWKIPRLSADVTDGEVADDPLDDVKLLRSGHPPGDTFTVVLWQFEQRLPAMIEKAVGLHVPSVLAREPGSHFVPREVVVDDVYAGDRDLDESPPPPASALLYIFTRRDSVPYRFATGDGLGGVVPAWAVTRASCVPGHVSIATEIPEYIQKTLDIRTELALLSRKEVMAVAKLSGQTAVNSYPATLWMALAQGRHLPMLKFAEDAPAKASKRVVFDSDGLRLAEEEIDSGLEFQRFEGWSREGARI
ncbi:hypothetical protein HDU67_004004 [Dinochytrium kinnereticum]|nr:hypothetical protein HDU67_004004 [Dinochytrium kinnereticum]